MWSVVAVRTVDWTGPIESDQFGDHRGIGGVDVIDDTGFRLVLG